MKGNNSEREPLAIIGMACRFPGADSPDEFWANILNGRDCITEVPADSHWDPADYFDADPKKPDFTYAKRGGFINPQSFEPLKYGIPPKALEATDTTQLLGMMVASEALADAGYGEKNFDRERVSCILGVTGTLELVIPLGARLGHPVWRKALLASGLDEEQTEAIVKRIADGFVPWQEQSFPGLLGNVVAGRIANYLDLGGTNCVSDAACASTLSAVNLAAMELWSGKADMVLTGGVDTFNDIFMYMCFSKTPALSPTGDARPFSADGDGTILGEGAGIFVMKRLADAVRDGDRIYATLRSVGSSSDGKGNAIYAPSATGQKRALRRAYEEAGLDPGLIGLVEGHGTGTKVGDAVEINALAEVFSEGTTKGRSCAVGSVKSQIGHTKAAAGAAGLIKAVLAMRHGVLPPTLKVNQPLDVLKNAKAALYLNTEARPWIADAQPRRAGVSAFGFGGSNFHCVVEEYTTIKEEQAIFWDDSVHMLAVADDSRAALSRHLKAFDTAMSWDELKASALASLRDFDQQAPCRLILLLEQGKTDLGKIIANAVGLLDKLKDQPSWCAPEGIYFGSGAQQGKLAVLFPGQGSQYCHMLRDLVCRFPQMRDVLADVDKAFAHCEDFGDDTPLSQIIYPPPSWDGETPVKNEEILRRTEHAQPAIGAISIGLLKLLHYFGIEPEAAAGHSYGEIPALCASNRFDADALYLLSRLRGKLMAEGEGDRGAMLAVRAPLNQVESFLAEADLDLVLANKNAPDQVVLSGSKSEIDRGARLLAEAGMRNKRLPVAAAFHSTLVAQASQPFFAELQKVDFPQSSMPVYSNTTGEPYPENPDEARTLLANQLAKPVEFVSEIRNMHAFGVHTFLELGPGARLTGLVKSILADQSFEALAVDTSSGQRAGTFDLARTLAQLATLGYPIKLDLWENAGKRRPAPAAKRPAMVVDISGANFVSEATKKAANRPMASVIRKRPITLPAASNGALSGATGQTTEVPLTKPFSTSPQAPTALPNQLAEAFNATQRNMAMLQKMQEDSARLHAQYLQGQEAANRTLSQLMQQQQQLLLGGVPPTQPAQFAPAPVPPVVQAVAPKPAAEARPQQVLPQPKPAAAPAPTVAGNQLMQALMTVVAEKTGYPTDMLEPEMSLDGDLGIDSIKRVEIFSALSEALPNLPAVEPDQMGSLLTLGDIVAFLGVDSPVQAAPVSASGPDRGHIEQRLIEVVSEKTGYPPEMLDRNMSLDGDLGIDSIKRVEIFSALSEAVDGLPTVSPEQIGSLITLGDIVDHLAQQSGSTAETVHAAGAPAAENSPPVADWLREIVAEKTGYPTDMLEMNMSLDGDLGIDSIKRVEILSALAEKWPQAPEIKPEQAGLFQTLGDIVTYLGGAEAVVVAAPAGTPAATMGEIRDSFLQIMADKTGYPPDMLEMDMRLDGDLGIDSIKRVEIFSTLQEIWTELPEIKPEQIGTFQTVGEITTFLEDQLGGKAAVAPLNQGPDPEVLQAALLAIVADKTGYPTEMLEPGMSLEGDLGIDSIKRVEILSALAEAVPGLPEPKPDEISGLQTPAEIVAWFASQAGGQLVTPVLAGPVPLEVATPVEATEVQRRIPVLEELHESGRSLGLAAGTTICVVGGQSELQCEVVKQLNAQDLVVVEQTWENPELVEASGLIMFADDDCDEDRLGRALMLAKAYAAVLPGKEKAFFTTVTRMDGALGFAGTTDNAIQAGFAGLLKTAAHEWPSVQCKALDVAPEGDARLQAATIVGQCLSTGPLEVAVDAGRTATVVLEDRAVNNEGRQVLQAGEVVLVSGGARGVTARCALALAERFSPTLVLLGRSEAPEPDEPDWARGVEDEAALKRAIVANSGERLKPKELQSAYQRLCAMRAMRANMAEMQAAGATVVYRRVDMRDGAMVQQVVAEIRDAYGPIRGLVHGAGVLADRRIEDKTLEQFERVYGTKVGGMDNLLAATRDDDLTMVVFFSSSTGRFGRTGQVDYAMANEVLNKTADQLRHSRPQCRTVSVNWGPWDGGMVTPELKKLFASEGIAVIPLKAGAQYLADELGSALTEPTEIVILGEGSRVEAIAPTPVAPAVAVPQLDDEHREEAFQLALNVESHPFLRAHVLAGNAVLPAVMMIEWCGHAAMIANMGFVFAGFERFRVLKGVSLEARETANLHFYTKAGRQDGDRLLVEVTMAGLHGEKWVPHCRLDVVLANGLPQATGDLIPVPSGGYEAQESIYDILFHGALFQGLQRVDGFAADGIAATAKAASLADQWMERPLRRNWLADPLALDCAFQMMVLWSQQTAGVPSLPVAIEGMELYGRFPRKEGEVKLVAAVREQGRHKAVSDIDFLDGEGRLIARIVGYECVLDAGLKQAYARRHLLAEVPN